MSKKLVRLTESDLNNIVSESVKRILRENAEDEGLWNNLKAGVNAFRGKGYGDASQRGNARNATEVNYNFGKRFNAARTAYKGQNTIDNNQKIINSLDTLISKYGENATLGQVKSNLGFGQMGAKGRIAKGINDIYA